MTPDHLAGAVLLLGLILSVVTIRRAWHEWLGVAS